MSIAFLSLSSFTFLFNDLFIGLQRGGGGEIILQNIPSTFLCISLAFWEKRETVKTGRFYFSFSFLFIQRELPFILKFSFLSENATVCDVVQCLI